MPLRERRGTWHYRFWVDGHEYTGSTDLAATERNRNAANRIEAKSRELVKSGREHELKLEVKPFNEAAAEFLTWAEGEHADHPNTTKRLRTSFASLAAFFGKRPVSSILRGEVRDYMSWRRKEHKVKEITLRHDLHALSKAFRYWIDHNWTKYSAVEGIEIPSDRDAVRIHVLTVEEERVYFAAAGRWSSLHDLGRLMLNQGCRPEEILALEKSHVNLELGMMRIVKGKSNAARRTLKLTLESKQILARLMASPKSSSWLFPSPKKSNRPIVKVNAVHEKALRLTETCRACGGRLLDHGKDATCSFQGSGVRVEFVPYDFRHTFATRAAEANMPVATLAAILGHRDLRSVMKYVHVRQEAADQAMAEFDLNVMRATAQKKEGSYAVH